MAIFQNSVIREHAQRLNAAEVDGRFKVYQGYFLDPKRQAEICRMKEEEYKPAFLQELFAECLGYTIRPDEGFNFTVEHKNVDDSKKADAAISHAGKTLAVIEVKATDTTDLTKAVAQAFGYKNHQPDARYIIATNFEKLRFYVDNAVEFEEFDLFRLDRAGFERLFLCLGWDNLREGLPLRLKAASVSEEDQITKRLYADYSAFREALFADLRAKNPAHEPLALFKKTQKLIDRFLFIFFAEDRGLLPANLTDSILKEWQMLRKARMTTTLYDRFKLYFKDLLEGNPEQDIFAYNGGLFRPDEVLDALFISDDVLAAHTLKLSNYDFASEVDVDILGHIFEHSLGEIEEVEATLANAVVPAAVSKRKKDGIFYTPKYITSYIVENTLGKLCAEKKAALGLDAPPSEEAEAGGGKKARAARDARLATCDAYREWLLALTICDPACGSGAFLNAALDFLMAEHRALDVEKARVHGDALIFSDIENSILERNLYGVDLNEESVEIAKLSLWLRTAQKGRKLSTLTGNIQCGNSLIDDPAVAGSKAFDWHKQFPQIFANGGFDVVIGNPPYVFAREKIAKSEKDFYAANFQAAKYQVNTYLLFVEKSVHICKERARYGLIVPNAWMMVYSGEGLRKCLMETSRIHEIVNLAGYSFEDADVETVILLAEKAKADENHTIQISLNNGIGFYPAHIRKQADFSKNSGLEFRVFADDASDQITGKLKQGSVSLDDIVLIKAGLKAYEKGKGAQSQTADDVQNRIYDFDHQHNADTHRYLDGSDVHRYALAWSGTWLFYGKHLAAPRTFDLFNGEKIIIREITGKYPRSIIAMYSAEIYLFNMSNIAVLKRPEKQIDLKYILAILNSSLMTYHFLKNTAKAVRKLFPKIILNDLRKFPFKEVSADIQRPFIALADRMLALNAELQAARGGFVARVRDNLAVAKITKALENFETLDFAGFLQELKRQKVKIPLSSQGEWEAFFGESKAAVGGLASEIAATDREIDQKVYALYGLTDEEIAIVEQGGS